MTEDTTGAIFVAEDDYGISYYYAGTVQDNWVKFAGFYWRIIRINGDGTIRMIYQETAANETGEGTKIDASEFNSNYNNNMYIGYMYTSGSIHGTGTASSIKGVLDTWYTNNLSGYDNYIATGGGATFCNDRQTSTSTSSINGSGGTGTITTYYIGFIRLITNKVPSLKCADIHDGFSTNIGLVTADEISYAGGIWNTTNFSYYLYTVQIYWTMSPSCFPNAIVFRMGSDGELSHFDVNLESDVRPVINLKANTTFSNGTGTIDNPYIVS